MHGLAVQVKEGLPFARDLSLENSADSQLCFRLDLLHSSQFLFFRSPSSSFCMVFYSFSSNIDEVLPINSSANVFVFGDFNVHHKDWLIYSGRTDRPGELCYNFSFSNDLTKMVNFPTRIPDCDSHSLALLDFYLLTLVFVPQWFSLYWESLIILLSQFLLTFRQTQIGMPHCIVQLMIILVLRDVLWEDIFKLSASDAASEICEWFQVVIDVYTPHSKYQLKSHLHGFQLLLLLPQFIEIIFLFVPVE